MLRNLSSIISLPSIRNAAALCPPLTSQTMVVFDVDNMLLTPKDPVLRPLTRPIANHPMENIYRLPSSEKEDVLSRLFTQAVLEITEPELKNYVHDIQSRRILTLALTAFKTPSFGIIQDTVSCRQEELARIGIQFKSSDWPSAPFHLTEFEVDPPYFKDGVLYSLHPKGETLKVFMKRFNLNKNVVAFDDNLKELTSMAEKVGACAIHYLGAYIEPEELPIDSSRRQVSHFEKTGEWKSLEFFYNKVDI